MVLGNYSLIDSDMGPDYRVVHSWSVIRSEIMMYEGLRDEMPPTREGAFLAFRWFFIT